MKDKESGSSIPQIEVRPGKLSKRGKFWSVYYLGQEIATRQIFPYLAACRWFDANKTGVTHIQDQHGSLISVTKGAELELVEAGTGFQYRGRKYA